MTVQPEPIIIVGAGGFGREVHSLLTAVNSIRPTWAVKGFIDDEPSANSLSCLRSLGSPHLGTIEACASNLATCGIVVAIGAPAARQAVVKRLQQLGYTRFPVLVHPDATLGQDVQLGQGTVVAAGARVTTAVRTGEHVHIDQNATLAHDSKLADYARLNPSATISGSVVIGMRSTIGANATVLQNRRVGDDCVVGAGAVVTRDVPNGTTAVGVPATWGER